MYEEIKQHRYKTEDFYRYADKNLYTKGLGLKWLSKNGQNMDTVQNPNSPSEFIDPQVIVDYILEHPTKSKEPGFMGNIDNVNETFNKNLELQKKNKLSLGFVYEMGLPSDPMLLAGMPQKQIELASSIVRKKSKKHAYDLSLLKDLPLLLQQNVIIVFESTDETKKGVYVLILEREHKNKNIAVVVDTNYDKARLNDIRSVHPREAISISIGFIKNGLRWVEQKKALQIISKQPYNSVEVRNILQGRSIATIIKNFENKKNVSTNLGGLEPMDMNMTSQIIDTKTKGQLGEWLQGYENKEYAIVLRGEKGAGKTRLLHQLMNFFVVQENKKIAFLSLEQDKNSGIAQSLFKEYIEHKALENIHVTSNTTGLKELEQIAKSKKYDVIAIDSFTKIKEIKQEDFDTLRKKYPHIIWLLIFQSTTGKVTRGGNMPEYDASVVIQVNKGGNAILEKNRYGTTENVFYVFEQKAIEN